MLLCSTNVIRLACLDVRYKKYVTLDPLGVVTKTRTSAQDADNDRLAAAPSTIQQKEELPQLAAESYFYVPGIGDVPEFSLPDFLPDLTGLLLYLLFMAALCSRCGHYIFILWFLFSFFFLSSFPRLISAVTHWMSTILLHMVCP